MFNFNNTLWSFFYSLRWWSSAWCSRFTLQCSSKVLNSKQNCYTNVFSFYISLKNSMVSDKLDITVYHICVQLYKMVKSGRSSAGAIVNTLTMKFCYDSDKNILIKIHLLSFVSLVPNAISSTVSRITFASR